MLALLQLSTLQLASKGGPAVLVHPINKELAGDADAAALPVLQLLVVDVAPFLQSKDARSTNTPANQQGNNKGLLNSSVA